MQEERGARREMGELKQGDPYIAQFIYRGLYENEPMVRCPLSISAGSKLWSGKSPPAGNDFVSGKKNCSGEVTRKQNAVCSMPTDATGCVTAKYAWVQCQINVTRDAIALSP